MAKYNVKLLDCTLRDGGYINAWNFGYNQARQIIEGLTRSGIDFIEVGFLRNVDEYDEDIVVCNYIQELNRLLPKNQGKTIYSAMAMNSNYDASKLSEYSGNGIQMIRVTAHDYDIEEGMTFAKIIKEKGYMVSINPINIMGYSDEQIFWMIEKVNDIQPYQFSIVDTFGSMKKKDLDRIVSLVDNNLDRSIRVGIHLHENMALSCYLAQTFIEKHLNRPITIDGSLMGMGRTPGNLPIELVADYCNEYLEKNYDIDYLMDAIQDYITPIKGKTKWGYDPVYFLSAKYNLHRNYAEHLINKGDITNKEINHILSRFGADKKSVFDAEYVDKLYEEYKNNQIDDSEDWHRLKVELKGRDVLIIAPGSTLSGHKDTILDVAKENEIASISVNFIPDFIKVDFSFFSNIKRFGKIEKFPCQTIITSNLVGEDADYIINYNSVSGAFDQGCNSFIMLLKLLKNIGVKRIFVAGADGYSVDDNNYYNNDLKSGIQRGNKFNLAVMNAISRLELDISFITPSKYCE